jgi:glucose-6-phosphate isomerase
MLHIDCTRLMADVVGEREGLTAADRGTIAAAAGAAHQKLLDWRGSQDALFADIIFDPAITHGIAAKAAEVASRFENLVVLGIGGSALGLRCIAQALLPPFWNLLRLSERGAKPRLFVCDNVDPETFVGLLAMADLARTCFVVISKSGTTVETAAQLQIVLAHLRRACGERWRDHVIAITDPDRGELRALARREGLAAFAVPPKLGGRFSVLSPVGLFPAACLGIDIEALLEGARGMARRSAGSDLAENPAYQIGGFHHWFDLKKGKPISVMMSYADALSTAADWYAQLWAESLGKAGRGQTPVKAVGATDQHSQVQLYMEGPTDKIFTFLRAERFRAPDAATRISEASDAFTYLNGHDLGAILRAEQEATAQALASMKRPSLTITFPAIDAVHLGEFFMLYETATAFAGALYGINPFDQPGVELGKRLTREILEKK